MDNIVISGLGVASGCGMVGVTLNQGVEQASVQLSRIREIVDVTTMRLATNPIISRPRINA